MRAFGTVFAFDKATNYTPFQPRRPLTRKEIIMADLRSTSVNASLTGALVPELKRGSMLTDGFAGEGTAAFLDAMMARITESKTEFSGETNEKNVNALKIRDASESDINEPVSIKEKIKERVREVLSSDKTPLKETRALKLLKKVSKFLVEAHDKGQVNLPKEVVSKLRELLVKDTDSMGAGEISTVMRDLIETFKSLNINMNETVKADVAQWPKEMLLELKELNVSNGAHAEAPVSMIQALRTLKALINKVDDNAIHALNDKKNEILAAIDPDHILTGALTATVTEDSVIVTEVPPTTNTIIEDLNQTEVEEPKEDELELNATIISDAVIAQTLSELITTTTQPIASTETTEAVAEELSVPLSNEKSKNRNTAVVNELTAFSESKLVQKTVAQQTIDRNILTAKVDKALTKLEAFQNAQNNASPKASTTRSEVLSSLSNGVLPVKNNDTAQTMQVASNAHTHDISALNAVKATTHSLQQSALTQQATRLPPSPATQQVMVGIAHKLNGNNTQFSLNLSPAELGRVEIRVTITRDGNASAVVTVDRPETLSLLQKDAFHLEKALQQAGLNTSQEQMSFNLREQKNAFQGFSQHKKRSLIDDDSLKIKEVQLAVTTEGSIISDNRINYHA